MAYARVCGRSGTLVIRLNCPCFICKTSLFVATNQRGGSLEAQISHNTSVSICNEDRRWFALVLYACCVAQIVALPMLQAQKGATTRPRSVSYAQDSLNRFSPATCGEYRQTKRLSDKQFTQAIIDVSARHRQVSVVTRLNERLNIDAGSAALTYLLVASPARLSCVFSSVLNAEQGPSLETRLD